MSSPIATLLLVCMYRVHHLATSAFTIPFLHTVVVSSCVVIAAHRAGVFNLTSCNA